MANQVTLSYTADQHARLLITDSKGPDRVQGRQADQPDPQAKVIRQATSPITFAADGAIENIADDPEPVYLIPKNLKLRIRIDGRHMTVTDRESLGWSARPSTRPSRT